MRAVDELKRAAARRALEYVRDGDIVGLGSGSTAEIFLQELGRRVADGLRIVGVPTSRRSDELARGLGIQTAELSPEARPLVTVDGADEVDRATLNVLKGRGGALLREKQVAASSDRVVLIVDDSKLVTRLGERTPVPVEVVRFGWRQTAAELARLGAEPRQRLAEGQPFVTDEGHYVLDCRFQSLADPARLAARIKSIVGVVEHGLFVQLVDRVIVAGEQGVEELVGPRRKRRAAGRAAASMPEAAGLEGER
ncbi:MAG: ribose-5-phosphate isomerase RpiA [Chloroflexi bacterium]|nr:ribose-5-phosphate isomerase RpiA [Chloroflexota bacterium]